MVIAAVPASRPDGFDQESFDRLLASFGAIARAPASNISKLAANWCGFLSGAVVFPEDHADETFNRSPGNWPKAKRFLIQTVTASE
jgi:hypothetical protein